MITLCRWDIAWIKIDSRHSPTWAGVMRITSALMERKLGLVPDRSIRNTIASQWKNVQTSHTVNTSNTRSQ